MASPDTAAPTTTPQSVAGLARWAWLGYLALGLACGLAYELLSHRLAVDAAYTALGLLCVAAMVGGVRINRPWVPAPWYILAASQALWITADTIYSWYEDVRGVDPFPSLADAFYLAAYPLIALGLFLLIRIRVRERDVGGVLDSVIVTTGLGLLLWVTVVQPGLQDAGGSPVEFAVGLAYPIGDIVLVGGVVRLLTAGALRNWSLWLLMGGVATQVVADTLYDAFDLYGAGESNGLDLLWMASYLLFGASALHPSMVALSRPAPDADLRFGVLRLGSMFAATLVAPVTLAVQHLAGFALDVWAFMIGTVVLMLLVVARMKVAIDQIAAVSAQRELLQRELAYQASHDALTSLPNRPQAMRLVAAALSRARRRGDLVALLFADLDGFKAVNDTHGHLAGDDVLRAVARRLTAEVRAGDSVARLGGDEFLALLETVDTEASAVRVAERLVDAVSQPISLMDGAEVQVGASIGISFNSDGSVDPEAFVHEADLAVYRAKAQGRGRVEVLSPTLRAELAGRAELEVALRDAIAAGELVLHYQPVVDLASGGVTGYEALVRWQRPGQGLLTPGHFIDVAEASDLICELDTWVLTQATSQLEAWTAEGDRETTVAVNLSGRHLNRDRVVDDVAAALRDRDVDPDRLVLEITETVKVDSGRGVSNLHRLRELGVRISLDDFGTGHNSIATLSRLPVDIVKIDQKYLRDSTPQASTMLRLLVHAAHAFGLPVVGEGVEDADQLALLQSFSVESAQGYYLGRPMPLPELERFRAARRHPLRHEDASQTQ